MNSSSDPTEPMDRQSGLSDPVFGYRPDDRCLLCGVRRRLAVLWGTDPCIEA
jgi:hypothetical protein